MRPKPDKSEPGIITKLFDINRDGKLDVVEEAVFLSAVDEMLSEEGNKGIKSNKTSRVVDLDDLDIKGI